MNSIPPHCDHRPLPIPIQPPYPCACLSTLSCPLPPAHKRASLSPFPHLPSLPPIDRSPHPHQHPPPPPLSTAIQLAAPVWPPCHLRLAFQILAIPHSVPPPPDPAPLTPSHTTPSSPRPHPSHTVTPSGRHSQPTSLLRPSPRASRNATSANPDPLL